MRKKREKEEKVQEKQKENEQPEEDTLSQESELTPQDQD
jgi:hypothetical protein